MSRVNAIKVVLWAAKLKPDSKPQELASTTFVGNPENPGSQADLNSLTDWIADKTAALEWGQAITITCCSPNSSRKK